MLNGLNTTRKADEERVQKVVKYVLESSDYSFEKLLRDKNLLADAEASGDSFFIKCPFHVDYSPSMRVSLSKGIFKCFSCGCGGGYFKFLTEYHKHVIKDNKNYYSIVEDILKADRLIQVEVGFNSIYRQTMVSNHTEFKRKKFNLSTIDDIPQTYIELANLVAKDKTKTESDIVYMILSMQSNMPVKTIYEEMYNKTSKLTETTSLDLDFSSILGN